MRRSVVFPIVNLIEGMQKVREGNYDQYTTVFSNDEIGQLKAHFNSMLDGLKQREFIKSTFGRFLSPEITRKILEDGSIDLGGEEVEASILFCDICGFTPLSERLSPAEVVALLNGMFSSIVPSIQKEKGVVNKYIGDCIMALFGIPEKIENQAEQSVKAAMGMLRELHYFNQKQRASEQPEVELGIGIHRGNVVAGNIGAQNRLEYTVIGDAVNVAARVESKTRELGCQVLVTDAIYENLGNPMKEGLPWHRFEGIPRKGKSGFITLYGLKSQELKV